MTAESRSPGFPSPPGWQTGWQALLERFPVLETLRACPQDPRFHREGDVLTHTMRVCEALSADQAWRRMPSEERDTLFAAALFHDIAKPLKTVRNEDGSVNSPGHSAAGARLVRRFLYREGGFLSRLSIREKVVSLVRHHSIPLWALDRPDPIRTVIGASLRTAGAELATLARADVAGRDCSDQAELNDRIELFEELCREAGCLDTPARFRSEIGRFLYLAGERSDPDCDPYDETAFQTTLLSGLPGSGKDTWISQAATDLPVVSLDTIRKRIGVSPDDNQGVVVERAKEEARELLRGKRPFVWNSTNITRSLRATLVRLFRDYNAQVRIVYLETPYDELLRRNAQREESLPQSVIQRLVDKLEPPELSEAPSVVWLET